MAKKSKIQPGRRRFSCTESHMHSDIEVNRLIILRPWTNQYNCLDSSTSKGVQRSIPHAALKISFVDIFSWAFHVNPDLSLQTKPSSDAPRDGEYLHFWFHFEKLKEKQNKIRRLMRWNMVERNGISALALRTPRSQSHTTVLCGVLRRD